MPDAHSYERKLFLNIIHTTTHQQSDSNETISAQDHLIVAMGGLNDGRVNDEGSISICPKVSRANQKKH